MFVIFRYFLEPASPLKSINASQQLLQQPLSNGVTKVNHQNASDSLAILKSIQLTPPAANNRHHHNRAHPLHQNGQVNGFSTSSDNNNNFFSQQNELSNGTPSSHNGSIKSDNSNDFVADFSKASIYNSNNSLNSTSSGGQVNGKMAHGIPTNSDVNINFADFENNKIYNVAGEINLYFEFTAHCSKIIWKLNTISEEITYLFFFFPFLFHLPTTNMTLKLFEKQCFSFPSTLFLLQRSITRTIVITIMQWPTQTVMRITFNGTFGNNFNGTINQSKIVGVSCVAFVLLNVNVVPTNGKY